MGIVLVRIDDRLIHGQVTVGWVRFLKAEKVVVANDKLSQDEFQKDLMTLSCPQEVLIIGVSQAASQIKRGEFNDKNTILLVAAPRDVLRLVEEGVDIQEVNVGGMRSSDDRREILPWVWLSQEEIDIFHKLKDLGIRLEARAVPTDPKIDLWKHIADVEARRQRIRV